MINIGFTGTQKGLTSEQKAALDMLLETYAPYELHHGDCVGADATAHDLTAGRHPACKIVIHPPINSSKRAFRASPHTHPPYDYLTRNHNIVHSSDVLIACPSGPEVLRSGTWATIRYARKHVKPIIICWPNGSITNENISKSLQSHPNKRS